MDKIILISDSKSLCLLIKKCVEQENYIVDIARNETEGLDMTANNRDKYSLIILDTETPDLNVSRFLQKIRKKVKLPVLMLTGTREKEPGIVPPAGADDYLAKPFKVNELIFRIHSLIRRHTFFCPVPGFNMDKIILKGMTIDNRRRTVSVNGLQAELTDKEFDLLSFPAFNKGKIFSKNRYPHGYGRKITLLMTAALFLLSTGFRKKQNRIRNIRLTF